MTRIFDALQQAHTEQEARTNVVDFPEPVRNTCGPELTAKLRNLYRSIAGEFSGEGGKIVQFVSARRGAGSTRVSRTFATVCAREPDRRILIVDTDAGFPQFCHFGIQPRTTWADTLRRNDLVTDACHSVGRSGIFLMKAWCGSQGAAALLEMRDFENSLDELRRSFDLIIFDSAPIDESTDCIDIASVLDGSVLVISAEKTRWQVASDIRNRIEARGGCILGVLLNEMRFHIPARVYDLL